jgi:pimeloyl-ACP methyl ester carboxylesterase
MIKKSIVLHNKKGKAFLADITYKRDGINKPIVIFAHGFKGFKDWGAYNLMSEYFANEGLVFVNFNFSHNGTTIEKPTEFDDLEAFGNNNFSIELDDYQTAIDAVIENKFELDEDDFDNKNIAIIGHSRGGGISILQASEDKRIKKLITWGSVNEFGKFWKQDQMEQIKKQGVIFVPNARTNQQMPIYWQMYQDYFDNLERLHIPTRFKALDIPILIVHGTADETVPFSAAEELCNWNSNALLLAVENANHNFGAKHPWHESEMPSDLKFVIDKSIAFIKKTKTQQ